MIHVVFQARSYVVLPHKPTTVYINARINWLLIIADGHLTICTSNDWFKRLLRFFGLRKMMRQYDEG